MSASSHPAAKSSRFGDLARMKNKRARTRGLLLDAAVDVIARRGIAATSVAQIVSHAGLAQGTFYYHFDSVEEIAEEAAHSVTKALVDEMRRQPSPGEDPALLMAFNTIWFCRRAVREPQWARMIVKSFNDPGRFRRNLLEALEQDVIKGVKAKSFVAKPSVALLSMMLAIVATAVSEMLDSEDSDAVAILAGRQILQMLDVPAGKATRIAEKAAQLCLQERTKNGPS